RPLLWTDESAGRSAQGVEETALADVWLARQNDTERPLAHGSLFDLLAGQRHERQSLREPPQQVLLTDKLQVLVAEVEARLDIGEQVEQVLAQLLEGPRHSARQLRPGLFQLTPAAGLDHAQHRLRSRQVELAREETAQGKLAGSRCPRSGS